MSEQSLTNLTVKRTESGSDLDTGSLKVTAKSLKDSDRVRSGSTVSESPPKLLDQSQQIHSTVESTKVVLTSVSAPMESHVRGSEPLMDRLVEGHVQPPVILEPPLLSERSKAAAQHTINEKIKDLTPVQKTKELEKIIADPTTVSLDNTTSETMKSEAKAKLTSLQNEIGLNNLKEAIKDLSPKDKLAALEKIFEGSKKVPLEGTTREVIHREAEAMLNDIYKNGAETTLTEAVKDMSPVDKKNFLENVMDGKQKLPLTGTSEKALISAARAVLDGKGIWDDIKIQDTITGSLSSLTAGRTRLNELDKIMKGEKTFPDISPEKSKEIAASLKNEMLNKFVTNDFSLTDPKKMDQFIKDFNFGTSNRIGITWNKDMDKVNDALKQLQKLVKADPNNSNPEITIKKFEAMQLLRDTCSNFCINDDLKREEAISKGQEPKARSTKYDQVNALLYKVASFDRGPLEVAKTIKGNIDSVTKLSATALGKLPVEEAGNFNPAVDVRSLGDKLNSLQSSLNKSTFTALQTSFNDVTLKLQDAVQKNDPAAIKLALQNLHAQTCRIELMVSNTPENSEKLTDAMNKLGAESVKQFFDKHPEANTDQLKTEAMKKHLVDSYKKGDFPIELTAMLSYQKVVTLEHDLEVSVVGNRNREAIINKTPQEPVPPKSPFQAAAEEALKDISKYSQEQNKAIGASKSERTAHRVPSEVTVHWIAELEKAVKADPENNELKVLLGNAKQHFMKHEMTLEKTKDFLELAAAGSKGAGRLDLEKLAKTLISQLPKDDTQTSMVRLQDNVYGRVFDSHVVNEMVKTPPPSVMTAMTKTKGVVHDWISDDKNISNEKLLQGMTEFQKTLKDKDPRFWFPKVPELEAVRDAATPELALAAFKKYLKSDVVDGNQSVSVPYAMCKFFLALGPVGVLPDWKAKGDKNYMDVHNKVVGRTALPGPTPTGPPQPDEIRITGVTHTKTKNTGITLNYQPAITPEDPTLNKSTRPTTYNMAKIADGDTPTEVVKQALGHGAPFASGVSGSTNIMMHLFESVKAKDPSVDVRDFLVGTMNFLVHDGGHSIHEVMWTANQLDKKMGLGLDLGDPDKPNDFVVDYSKIVALYDKDPKDPVTKGQLETVMSTAFDKTSTYFEENSHFAKT